MTLCATLRVFDGASVVFDELPHYYNTIYRFRSMAKTLVKICTCVIRSGYMALSGIWCCLYSCEYDKEYKQIHIVRTTNLAVSVCVLESLLHLLDSNLVDVLASSTVTDPTSNVQG